MPAITVPDLSTIPKLATTAGTTDPRPVRILNTAVPGFEGDGFPVRRAFAGLPFSLLDPFLLMDQIGEIDYAPGEPKGTPWHPHRGFETVTYVIDGELVHRDSHGGGGVITNGDTQWMTAGSGILHIERPPEHLVASGGLFHGVQLWVNLPRDRKFVEPRYQDIRGDRAATVAFPDGGALVRVIAGSIDGHAGPGTTHTPITLAHATLAASARLELPWPRHHNALVYVLAGEGTVGAEGRPIARGQLAVLGAGDTIVATAATHQHSRTPNMDVLILGGAPIGDPVVHYGPFVMNDEAGIRRAIEDYRAGRFGAIPAAPAFAEDD